MKVLRGYFTTIYGWKYHITSKKLSIQDDLLIGLAIARSEILEQQL